MKGLDTNVILRLITRDDAEQFKRAHAFIEQHCTERDPGFINTIVLAEVFWALKTGYRYSRDEVITVIESLTEAAVFSIEDPESVAVALDDCRKGADFADALIASRNKTAGCESTASFDNASVKHLPDFEPIPA